MVILQTTRLKLVPYGQGDIDGLYAVMKDERVMRHIGKGPMSHEDVVALVARVEKRWSEIGMGWWAIRLKLEDRIIGQICLQPLTDLPEIEVGFALEPASWGGGLAQEALEEVLRHSWQDRQLASVVATVRPDNQHSTNLLLRCGFAFEAELSLPNKKLLLYRAMHSASVQGVSIPQPR